MGLLLILLLFVLFWAFLIRPKQREMRRHQELVATLEVGDEVMTGSGFYGEITAIEGDIVHIELAPGVEVRVARRAVAAKVPAGADALPAGEQDDLVDAELVDEEDEVVEPLEDITPHDPDLDAGSDDEGPEDRH